MDTTERYIKKCSTAQQIQEGYKKIEEGDFILFLKEVGYYVKANEIVCCGLWINTSEDSDFVYTIFDGYDGCNSFWRDAFIWLPRIDQLIDILKIEWQDNLTYVELIQKFNEWFESQTQREICLHSPEELWLEFVMDILYDYIWQVGYWVKKDG